VTTLLYQSLTPPWGERLVVDRATNTTRPVAADARDAGVIADEIAASAGLDDDDRACDDPAGWAELVRAAGPPAPARRERLWAGSPVPSSKFE
jgi:hypothetical protein